MARLRFGVLGGTFDPIHLGHLVLASCAAIQLELDRVIFVPAGDPWRKAGRRITLGEDRLEMVRLAVAGDPRFAVDDRELRRAGPTYTSNTLTELKAELGESAQLYFLVGQDALDDMRFWHRPELIFKSATLAVAPRLDTPVPAAPPGHDTATLAVPPFDRIEMPYIGISSSDLRARAARGESLRYLVPEGVEGYIREKSLYRS
jgi:nicotinate-nucleotide adenylyltransferase